MMKDGERVFIDTNILLRANIPTAPLHEAARKSVENLWDEGAELWISRQVLREYIVNVSREQGLFQPMPPATIEARISYFQRVFRIADDKQETTKHLLKLLQEIKFGGKQVHDANIVATMLSYNIPYLLTLNIDDFKRFSAYITLLPIETKP
jgi:predicted nucleic acid-binding protein